MKPINYATSIGEKEAKAISGKIYSARGLEVYFKPNLTYAIATYPYKS